MKLNYNEIKKRSETIKFIRSWFDSQNVLEVETPVMNTFATVEAHLNSFEVKRQGIRKSSEVNLVDRKKSYLITSPEYNLKKVLTILKKNIFQLAHCFREEDKSPWHREEFLMLEWYLVDKTLHDLMDFCETFLNDLSSYQHGKIIQHEIQKISIDDLFQKFLECTISKKDLLQVANKHKLIKDINEAIIYDDLFFLVFLNLIEPHIRNGIYFLYDYPENLAALSKIKNKRAMRFEIYWNGIELANGYEELQSEKEYIDAFTKENKHRQLINKKTIPIDQNFIQILKNNNGLPVCSGIALGLDRLLAILFSAPDIHSDNTMSV